VNELGNKYPLAAIRERRAEMAGEITSLQKRLRQLRESLVHVDATIRLFDPDGDPTKIPGKAALQARQAVRGRESSTGSSLGLYGAAGAR
jgi:hypothetical protein